MNWIEVDVRGRKLRVAVAKTAKGAWAAWNGQTRFVGPEIGVASNSTAVEREIRAPMTGRVVKVAAAPGQAVRASDVLVVLEAMKMEYRLVAPRDGTVESVGCSEGERVDLGRVLVTLAP
jgi:biotin carboxyl carrier protein